MSPHFFRRCGLPYAVITLACISPSFGITAYVRVNQIGYESGVPARAYLMTAGPVNGASYIVENSGGRTVASGPVGAIRGNWGTYSVYSIDFMVRQADTYIILVGGAVTATSPVFPVDTAVNLYSAPLANNLHYYENGRDGPNFISTPLRTAPGHLNDVRAEVYNPPTFDSNDNIIGSLSPVGAAIDATGGWWDAGDYLKFVQTQSYVVALMLIGVRDFPRQMGALSEASNFIPEAEFGLDWLQQMWDDRTRTLYYQVGIGTDFVSYNYLSDHDIWRLPQDDDTFGGTNAQYQYIRHRPAFVAGPAGSKISPNLAGRLAAAFAGCFQVFRASHPELADECLLSAEHVFDLADIAPSGNLLTTSPYDFYPESEWRDDLELGATEIYFALRNGNLPGNLPHSDPKFYLAAAAHWAHAYIQGAGDQTDTLNLYDVSGLAHFELYRAIALAGNPGGLAVTRADLLNDVEKQIQASIASANKGRGNDPFNAGWPWDGYDTVSHGAGLSVMAAEYNFLSGDQVYDTDSRRWLGNISGANAWGVTFTVGDGDTFPECMQHQVANLAGSLNGQPPLLNGAVVEGPNSAASWGAVAGMEVCPPGGGNPYKQFDAQGAVYKDDVQSYTTDEPAIDLSASSFLMYAWRMAGEPKGMQ